MLPVLFRHYILRFHRCKILFCRTDVFSLTQLCLEGFLLNVLHARKWTTGTPVPQASSTFSKLHKMVLGCTEGQFSPTMKLLQVPPLKVLFNPS